MLKALKADVPSPSSVMRSQINPVLHRSLENVCLKAIAKDPKERYPTAKALADDLTRWLGGEEVEADLPTLRRRRKTMFVGGAVAAAAAVVTLAAVLFAQPSLERQLASASEFLARGEYASAREAYERILVSRPGQKDAVAGRDEIRRRLLAQRLEDAEKLLEAGRPSEAFDAFMLILLEDPAQKRAQEGKEEAKRRMVLSGGHEKKTEIKRP
jgi:tetratricopeptide (TPR) repeat protein